MKVVPKITNVVTKTITGSDLPTEMPILFGNYLYWIHSGSDYITYCYYNTVANDLIFKS